jgi:hypothetical protein
MQTNPQAQQASLPQMTPSPSASIPTNPINPFNQNNPINPNKTNNPINPTTGSAVNQGSKMEGVSLSLSPMPGGGDDSQMDLSRYGGVKPDFDAMERDDDKAIENLNAQLLGIQTGGQNESLERAKQQGIESVMSNSLNAAQQQVNANAPLLTPQLPSQFYGSSGGGLNFSFDKQQQQQQPALRPQLSMPIHQSAGGEPMQKQVSFNNDIKVVELDTKISEGFLYSGSKNLDPFGQ